MKHLYLDLSSGIAGDMFVAALLDLGVDPRVLTQDLQRLPVQGYHLHVARRMKAAIHGTKFDVHLTSDPCPPGEGHAHEHPHPHEPGGNHGHHHSHGDGADHVHGRSHSQIRSLLEQSTLPDWVRTRALSIFQRIAIAEGKIHGLDPAEVQFHEVGAVDSIVDIVGACLAMDQLGRPRVSASAVVEGTGFVRCAHGRMPLPAAATLEILGARSIPISQCEEPHEMVTPTGAAILAEFAESFGPMSGVVGARVGYGLGTRDHRFRTNVLRAVLWEGPDAAPEADWETDSIAVLESNIDDLTPEVLGAVLEKALRLGALDAFHTSIQMKKQRPGILLTLLVEPNEADRFSEFLLTETSAFGVRRTIAERRKLKRHWVEVQTPYGTVRVKLGLLGNRTLQAAPEHESCRSVAAMAGVPIRLVHAAAAAAANQFLRDS